MMTRLKVLLVLALGALACNSGPPPAEWVERELEAPSENVMWEIVWRSMERMKLPRGSGMDRAELRAESGWLSRPSPFKGKGYRRRAFVEVEPQGEGRFLVRARVQRQRNEALVNPADLRYAEWEWDGEEVEVARILLQHMSSFLEPELPLEGVESAAEGPSYRGVR